MNRNTFSEHEEYEMIKKIMLFSVTLGIINLLIGLKDTKLTFLRNT